MRLLICLATFVCLGSAIPLGLKPLEEEGWLQICCVDNDKNEDGAISFREFSPFVLAVLDLNRKELERIFLTADQDKNSDLDGSECPVVRQLLRDTMKQRIQEFKTKYDADSDGNINQTEVRRLALNEFGVPAEDADLIFARSHHGNGQRSNSEWTELLLELRSKAVKTMGARFSKWATTNKKEQLSYGDLKRFDPALNVPTLKRNFKKVDYNKDLYISPIEYMALVRELRDEGKEDITSTTASTTLTTNTILSNNLITSTQPSRARRGASVETAPPLNESEIKTVLANSNGRKSAMEGGRKKPSLDFNAPTVPFDDPDFE